MRRMICAAVAAGVLGCGTAGPTVEEYGTGPEPSEPIPARYGSVIDEGCTLDSWQTETLASAPARRVLGDVVLVCPTIHATGVVDPVDADSRASITQEVTNLRAMGYKVRLAVAMGDDLGDPYQANEDQETFASAAWRAQVTQNLEFFASSADGLEIDLQKVPSGIQQGLTEFMIELATAYRASTALGIFVPPSTQEPSDVPGGDAYDLATIAQNVDRVRVMTLDFSTGTSGGPTIDSGWAVDAMRFAESRAGTTPLDVAFPLYGTDFSALGERSVTFLEATAVAEQQGATPARGPTGALNYGWVDESGQAHVTWYDDGVSTVRTLHAWDTATLPANVGVVFYGLGAEDPALWDTISRGMP
jgi:glycosyl hydrolase family 18 (putative chitinase)